MEHSCSPPYIGSVSPTDLARATPESEPVWDGSTLRDQNIDAALHLAGEPLEHAVRRPVGKGVQTVTFDAGRLDVFQHSSPMTRLPPEMLAYIFRLYVAWSVEQSAYSDIRAQGPFRLAQVCTFWRAVTVSDPHLWTSIHFYIPESHQSREDDIPGIHPVLDLHLKRSGALPISLTFTDHRTYHFDTNNLVSFLVDRLRAHARRWKSISFHSSCGYSPFLFTFSLCDLSSLEYLHISGDSRLSQRFQGLHLNLKSGKNLKSFSFSGPRHSVDGIHLHWGGLSEVSFGFSSHGGANNTLYKQFKRLYECRNITTCSLGIEFAGPPLMPAEFGRTITLPCLETFRVRRLSADAHASGTINLLTLPRLQTLEIDASALVGWNQRWHDRTFSGLLARSGCTLLRLSIEDVDFPNDELVRCLALSPALTSLRFIPCPRSQDIRDVVHRLDVSYAPTGGLVLAQGRHEDGHVANAGPLVPQLREITLASSVEGCLDSMMAMFRSRVGPPGRARAVGAVALRRVEVVFFDMWHDTDVGGRGGRSERVAGIHAELARWVSENSKNDDRRRGERGDGDGDGLEASVVVNSPYLPEYIDAQQGSRCTAC